MPPGQVREILQILKAFYKDKRCVVLAADRVIRISDRGLMPSSLFTYMQCERTCTIIGYLSMHECNTARVPT